MDPSPADVAIPARLQATFSAVPLTDRAVRDAIYLAMEARALGFAVNPKLMAPLARMAVRHLEKQVADPALRATLTPDYTIGCKRILLSSTYYPALQRPNVELIAGAITGDITGGITEITETGVVTADGRILGREALLVEIRDLPVCRAHLVGQIGQRLNLAGLDLQFTPQLVEFLAPRVDRAHQRRK